MQSALHPTTSTFIDSTSERGVTVESNSRCGELVSNDVNESRNGHILVLTVSTIGVNVGGVNDSTIGVAVARISALSIPCDMFGCMLL